MSKFKVGDLVNYKLSEAANMGDMVPNKVYTVSHVDERGGLRFNNVRAAGWYPENFELAKSQIINNILNDL